MQQTQKQMDNTIFSMTKVCGLTTGMSDEYDVPTTSFDVCLLLSQEVPHQTIYLLYVLSLDESSEELPKGQKKDSK